VLLTLLCENTVLNALFDAFKNTVGDGALKVQPSLEIVCGWEGVAVRCTQKNRV
jgi:hypothetical protein